MVADSMHSGLDAYASLGSIPTTSTKAASKTLPLRRRMHCTVQSELVLKLIACDVSHWRNTLEPSFQPKDKALDSGI